MCNIIDFHTHIFPEQIVEKTIAFLAEKGGIPAYSDGTLDGLNAQLNSVNAYMGIALPVLTRPESFEKIFEFCKKVNEDFKKGNHRVLSFAAIHPDCENLEEKMFLVKQNGFKGIKIHPDYQDFFIDDEKSIRLLNAAIEQDLIVVTHAGLDVGHPTCTHCTPKRAAKALDKLNGEIKMVFAHFGGCEMYDEVYAYLAGRNVYFDTSYVLNELSKETFYRVLEKHGEDKILFATDSPWKEISTMLSALGALNLPNEAEEKILFKNALKLLSERE